MNRSIGLVGPAGRDPPAARCVGAARRPSASGPRSPGPPGLLRPLRPVGDPGGQVGPDRFGQQLARRHLERLVRVLDRLDQQAVLRVAGHDRRPALAALEHRLARVEPQPAAGLLRPVALDARAGQHRPHLQLEEALRLVGRTVRRGRERRPRPAESRREPPTAASLAWKPPHGPGTGVSNIRHPDARQRLPGGKLGGGPGSRARAFSFCIALSQSERLTTPPSSRPGPSRSRACGGSSRCTGGPGRPRGSRRSRLRTRASFRAPT